MVGRRATHYSQEAFDTIESSWSHSFQQFGVDWQMLEPVSGHVTA